MGFWDKIKEGYIAPAVWIIVGGLISIKSPGLGVVVIAIACIILLKRVIRSKKHVSTGANTPILAPMNSSRYSPAQKPSEDPLQKGKSLNVTPSDYIVVDIETTGLSFSKDSIIEIGAIKFRNDKQVETFNSLLHFNGRIGSFIENLTGITDEMLSSAPPPKSVLESFYAFIGDDILVAHNASFDIGFLYNSIWNHLNLHMTNDYVDTLKIARYVYPSFETHKLDSLCDALKVKRDTAHRALSDVYATAQIYILMKNEMKDKNIGEFLGKKYTRDAYSIKPTVNEFDENHPMYNKYFVLVGRIGMSRPVALQRIVNNGGKVTNDITKNTNYLVIGISPSARERPNIEKAALYREKYNQVITEIHEEDFLKML